MDIESNFEGITFKVFPQVYEPAEDSFLLAKHAKKLKGKVLEIGCGCGVVSITNAKNNPKNNVYACDISNYAIKNSKLNAKNHNVNNIRIFKTNLFSSITVGEKFDYILFNPPYLPTTKSEKIKNNLDYAFDGGKSGRKTIDRFILQFPEYLKPKGVVYLIHSSLNDLEKTKILLNKKGFKMRIIATESFFFEKLYLLKIQKA